MVYLELSLFLFLNKNNIINAPLPLYVLVHELRAHVCVRVRMCMCMHMWRRGGQEQERCIQTQQKPQIITPLKHTNSLGKWSDSIDYVLSVSGNIYIQFLSHASISIFLFHFYIVKFSEMRGQFKFHP